MPSASASSTNISFDNMITPASEDPKGMERPKGAPTAGEDQCDDASVNDEKDEQDNLHDKHPPSKDSEQENEAPVEVDKSTEKDVVTRPKRRELPPETVSILKKWLFSPEHVRHPYPTEEEKQELVKQTGMDKKQLTNWFTNARKRLWKPMIQRENYKYMQIQRERGMAAPPDLRLLDPRNRSASMNAALLGNRTMQHPYPQRSFEYDQMPPQMVRPDSNYLNARLTTSNGDPFQTTPVVVAPPQALVNPRGRAVSESQVPRDMVPRRPPQGLASYEHNTRPPYQGKRTADQMSHVNNSDNTLERPAAKRMTHVSPQIDSFLMDWLDACPRDCHPYPTEAEKIDLCRETGLEPRTLNFWLITNRKRYWRAAEATEMNSQQPPQTLPAQPSGAQPYTYRPRPPASSFDSAAGRGPDNYPEAINKVSAFNFRAIPRPGRSHTVDLNQLRREPNHVEQNRAFPSLSMANILNQNRPPQDRLQSTENSNPRELIPTLDSYQRRMQ